MEKLSQCWGAALISYTQDSTREIAPAQAAADAILFDNTGMSLEESVAYVVGLVREKTDFLK